MKTRLIILVLVLLSVAAGSAFAGEYSPYFPADYCHQKAFFIQDGSVVFGLVRSGSMSSQYVVGYKKTGILGKFSTVNLLLRVVLESGKVIEHRLVLNREWNGTGFMSEALPSYFLYPFSYQGNQAPERIRHFELAFSVNDQWDSKHGKNYIFTSADLSGKGDFKVEVYNSVETAPTISLPIWKFIVDLMRS
ncbi:MAG: hypothetical protein HQM10_09280 [Candidatus Riflebacteria bacterium]|nr:hypothetical protein [Candidatus Riflebacteria bacterium]